MRYVLYHGVAKGNKAIAGCYDGFGAAFAAYRKFGDDNTTYIPVAYGQPLPEIMTGSDVFLVDFSYPRDTMLDLCETHNRVTVYDHHKTAEEALAGLEHPNLHIVFDMERSGAEITWAELHGGEAPWLIRYIGDRDLWKFKLPGSWEVHTILQSHKFDFDVWQSLYLRLEDEQSRNSMVQAGAAVVQFRDSQVDKMCEQATLYVVGGYETPVVNATCMWSEVANKLLDLYPNHPMAMAYFIRGDGVVQLSLRSRKDFDCSLVAKGYGGGGHAQASGCNVSRAQLEEILNKA